MYAERIGHSDSVAAEDVHLFGVSRGVAELHNASHML